jgi:hypothetical protein
MVSTWKFVGLSKSNNGKTEMEIHIMSKKNRRLSSCWSILLLLVISAPAFAQYRDNLGGNCNNPAGAMITNIIMDRYARRRLEQRFAAKRSGLPEGEGFDADYFLLDQDTSGFSEKNISVSGVAVKGATATAIVTFGSKVKVSLIQEGGVWKIDKVKNESGESLVK